MNPAFQVMLLRIFAILGVTLLFFSARANTSNQAQQQQQFDRAIELMEAFQNDSAYHLLSQLHQELEASQALHTSFGLQVRLRQAEALERDHQDETAIERLLPVAEEARTQAEWEVLANAHLSLARLYEKLGFDQRCRAQLQLAQTAIFPHDVDLVKARYYTRLASYHRIFADRDSALHYAEATVAQAQALQQAPEEAVGHLLLGMLHHRRDFDRARHHYHWAAQHWLAYGDYQGYGATHNNLANLYQRHHQLDRALLHLDTAAYAAQQLQHMGIESTHLLSSNHLDRAELLRQIGQLDSALHYLDRGYELQIQELEQDKREEILNIAAQYNEERQAQQIANQNVLIRTQRARRNLLIGLCAIILLFAGLLTWSYLRLRRTNRQNEVQARELQQLDAVKSKLFSNISHELRTPLSLILGPLSVLLEQPESWNREELKKQLLLMQRNGKSLLQLVEEILDLSKLEANQIDLVEEDTVAQPFFEEVTQAFSAQFAHEGIAYTTRFDLAEGLALRLDRKKLTKVLHNFLYNALKFTPMGGTVTCTVVQSETQLRIAVADTGRGIPAEDLDRVFDRYFQSFQPGQQQHGGTGIGLAMVKEFAKLMGGRAYVHSELGRGSQFFFEFPLVPVAATDTSGGAAEDLPLPVPAAGLGSAYTILVVEDNRDLRHFIQRTLEANYRQVLLAENGLQALKQLQEHGRSIHLVVTDVMMPQMDGWALLERIKQAPDWQHIPVVMLTSLATAQDQLRALTTGVDDYLTKPFTVPELRSRIYNLLQHHDQRLEWQRDVQIPTEVSSNSNGNSDASDPQDLLCSEEERQWVNDLRRLIEERLEQQKIGVEQLAAAVYLSSRQLNRRLKRITGLSPAKFIKEVQLQAARADLELGQFNSISEVAYRFGFEHQATFSTSFKNRFGISPSEFRKGRGQRSAKF